MNRWKRRGLGALTLGTILLSGCLDRAEGPKAATPRDTTIPVHDSSPSGAPSGPGAGKICLLRDLAIQGRVTRFQAVCREPDDVSHATPGLVDLRVLVGPQPWSVVAETLGIEIGSDGDAGEVKLVHLGTDRYAFGLAGGYLGMGHFEETTELYSLVGKSLRSVLSFTSTEANEGSGECLADSTQCLDRWTRLVVDSSQPREWYPVTLVDTGSLGPKILHRIRKLAFDPVLPKYLVPEDASESP